MNLELKTRILRVAEQARLANILKEFVGTMADFADSWASSSSQLTKAIETRDVDLLSRAILENRKQAEQMNFVMKSYERVLSKLGGNP